MAAFLSAAMRHAGVGGAGLQLGALLGVLAIYFAFNKPINDRLFSEAALSDESVGKLLRRWAAWHWARVALGLVAFVAAS